MPHVVTGLCMRDGACVDICPVEAIVLGNPESSYPWAYIDPETCIDCSACMEECAYVAIYPSEDVPTAFEFDGRVSFVPHETGKITTPSAGTVLDLRSAVKFNEDYFLSGPGYG